MRAELLKRAREIVSQHKPHTSVEKFTFTEESLCIFIESVVIQCNNVADSDYLQEQLWAAFNDVFKH